MATPVCSRPKLHGNYFNLSTHAAVCVTSCGTAIDVVDVVDCGSSVLVLPTLLDHDDDDDDDEDVVLVVMVTVSWFTSTLVECLVDCVGRDSARCWRNRYNYSTEIQPQ